MHHKYRLISTEVTAVKFNQRSAWPKCVTPWPYGGAPRDGSSGYIVTPQGNIHILAGQWIVTFQDGTLGVYTDADFSKYFEVIK